MKWFDFDIHVMPYVIGCPMPTMEHHARNAAIEFLVATRCWVRALEPMITSATDLIELEADSPLARIFDVQRVTVDGVPAAFTWGGDLSMVQLLSTLREPGLPVVCTVAMTLKHDAPSFPDEFRHYVNKIACGAIASIKAIPGQSFSDASGYHETMFRDHIRTESARLARGQVVSGSWRAIPSFL